MIFVLVDHRGGLAADWLAQIDERPAVRLIGVAAVFFGHGPEAVKALRGLQQGRDAGDREQEARHDDDLARGLFPTR
jgi:hypothetical protein